MTRSQTLIMSPDVRKKLYLRTKLGTLSSSDGSSRGCQPVVFFVSQLTTVGWQGAGQRVGRARAPAGSHLPRVATVREILPLVAVLNDDGLPGLVEERRVE